MRLGRTLKELNDTISVHELYTWMAYDRISPISDIRNDIHAAQISSSILQSQGSKVSLTDMLINWSGEEKEVDEEELISFFTKLS